MRLFFFTTNHHPPMFIALARTFARRFSAGIRLRRLASALSIGLLSFGVTAQAVLLFPLNAQADSVTWTVNTLQDHDDSACDSEDCTLREAITESAPGDVIRFAEGITGTMALNGVLTVSHDVTIQGTSQAGLTLSGIDSYRHFDVDAGATLTISDMTLANGYDDGTGGGSVRILDGNVNATRVTFRANYADNSGGAISDFGGYVTLTDSAFVGNYSDYNGGAIHLEGDGLTVTNTRFNGNYSNGNGGAIDQLTGTVTILGAGSVFSNNTSNNYGGAIEQASGDALLIRDATFIANSGSEYGGAIDDEWGDFSVTNTAFIANNIRNGGHGGAVSAGGANVHVVSSTFEGNTVIDGGSGGAMVICTGSDATIDGSLFKANATVSGSASGGAIDYECSSSFAISGTDHPTQFIGNSTDYEGGALYLDGGPTRISNTIFEKNTTREGEGGAILQYNDLAITSSSFMGNISSDGYWGGAIYGDAGVLTVASSTFENNAVMNDGSGGALYVCEDTTIVGTTFRNNSTYDYDGGAIYQDCGSLFIQKSLFDGNSAWYGGALELEGDSATIQDSTFFQNASIANGAAIASSVSSTFSNVTIAQNAGESGLHVSSNTVHLRNTILAGNGSQDCRVDEGMLISDGHNLESDSSCTLSGTGDQMDIDAKLDPRGLQNLGGPTRTLPTLSTSPAVDAADPAYCGETDQRGTSRSLGLGCDIGAFEQDSDARVAPAAPVADLVVTTLTDRDNGECVVGDCSLREAIAYGTTNQSVGFATGLTGVITLGSPIEISVSNPQRIMGPGAGTITLSGAGYGRIILTDSGSSVAISGLTFASGYAIGSHGGAIENLGALSVTDSVFRGNYSDNTGGAISDFGDGLTLTDDTFVDNNGDVGGAVFSVTPRFLTTDSTYVANYGYEGGGALFLVGGEGTVQHASFIGNQAYYTGGAIYFDASSRLGVTDSDFSANGIYEDGGGAIDSESGILDVSHSTFTANGALFGSEGAIAGYGDTLSVSDSVFTGNNAFYDAPTMGVCVNTHIERSVFADNQGTNGSGGAAIDIQCGYNTDISDSTFRGNTAFYGGGAIHINSSESTAVSGSTFDGNSSIYDLGGALNQQSGDLVLSTDVFTHNENASAEGGGAINANGNHLAISQSAFTENAAQSGGGGAIVMCTNTTIDKTAFTDNTTTGSSGGGAIYQGCGNADMANTTFSGNTSLLGGALYTGTDGHINARNSTFSQNVSLILGYGGVLYADYANSRLFNDTFSQNLGGTLTAASDASLQVENSILTASDANHCNVPAGTISSLGHTIDSTGSCEFIGQGDQNEVDPLLDVQGLKNNGGDLLTIALAAHSPAIDAGDASCPATDEIGTVRPSGAACDIGAFEATGVEPAVVSPPTIHYVTTLDDRDNGECLDGDCSFREAITYSSTGDVIAFAEGLHGIIRLTLGQLVMDHNLTVQGPGQLVMTVSGLGSTRIFAIDPGTAVTVSGLTISDGYDQSDDGGAILNEGSLRLENSVLQANYADGYGGAIAHYGTALNLNNVVLSGNYTQQNGGAIYDVGGLLSVTSSTFSGNNSENSGGAIDILSGDVDFTQSIFSTNHSLYHGGALYIENANTITVSSTEFDTNNSSYGVGGAIDHESGALTLSNSSFRANITNDGNSAGAIYGDGQSIVITSSTFMGNVAYDGGSAGAILVCSDLSIDHSLFVGNTSAFDQAGVIYQDSCGTALSIDQSTFNANSAYGVGGALVLRGNDISITDSTFTNNTSLESGGGAIYEDANRVAISGSTFSGNTVTDGYAGGAIDAEGNIFTSSNDQFINNAAHQNGAGGAVYVCTDTHIDHDTFRDNSTPQGYGAALYQGCNHLDITGTLFAGGSAYQGGAIYSDGGNVDNITNTTFFQNNATEHGAAIYSYVDTNLTNDTFSQNAGQSALMAVGSTMLLQNTILSNGDHNCQTLDGDIYSDGHNLATDSSCSLNDSLGDQQNADAGLDPRGPQNHGGDVATIGLLDTSTAIDAGGSIGCPSTDMRGVHRTPASCDIGAYEANSSITAPENPEGDLTVTTLLDRDNGSCAPGDCSFREAVENATTGQSIGFANGLTGIISLDSELGSIHVNASQSIHGPGASAITVSGQGNQEIIAHDDADTSLSLSGLNLVNGNNASGGAIYSAGPLEVSDTTFRNNGADDWGGALAYDGQTVSLTRDTFTGNSANLFGGAVDLYANAGLTIDRSTFVGNYSDDRGGAALFEGGDGVVTSSVFVANNAAEDGGALADQLEGTMRVNATTFNGNMSWNDAGAVITYTGPSSYSHTSFTGNHTRGQYGGALTGGESDQITIDDGSSFTGNTAYYGGGAIINCANTTIDSSRFIANSALHDSGGAIQSECGGITITGYQQPTVFEANSARSNGGAAMFDQDDTATLNHVQFTDNAASTGNGGAVWRTYADLAISDTQFIRNNADSTGGAIMIQSGGDTSIARTQFTDNSSSGFGGAIDHEAAQLLLSHDNLIGNVSREGGGGAVLSASGLTSEGSYFANNVAANDYGGAMRINDGAWSMIQDSTFFQNVSVYTGAAISVQALTDVNGNTFAQNTASVDYPVIDLDGTTILMENTILDEQHGCGSSNGASVNSQGHNISPDTSCDIAAMGDLSSTDAILSAAGPVERGGFSPVIPLMDGSPALDAGSGATVDSGSGACTSRDIRGRIRPLDGNSDASAVCDIGSYEKDPTLATIPAAPSSIESTPENTTITLDVGLPSTDGGAEIYDYRVRYRVHGSEDWSIWSHVPSTGREMTIRGLSEATNYDFAVAAINYRGVSEERTTVRATTGGDVTPPSISDIQVAPSTYTAVVTWTTDEDATAKVVYSPDTSYSYETVETGEYLTSQSVTLTDLVACATYHYKVVSHDASSNTTTSTADTFTTSGCAGGANVVKQSANTVTTVDGGTVTMTQNGTTSTLVIPDGFTTTSTSIEFQIKQIDASTALGVIGKPSSNVISAGEHTYDIKALIDSTTTLDSFDAPITVTLTYTDADVSGITESSLWIYRFHGGVWIPLDHCSVNTDTNTITCTTQGFSTFSLFGEPTPAPASGGGGGGGSTFVDVTPRAVTATGSRPALDFSINHGASMTSSSVVTLSFNADTSTVRSYAVSTDPNFAGTSLIPYTPSAGYILPSVTGVYTIYVRFYSTTGLPSAMVSHSIELVVPMVTTVAPTTSVMPAVSAPALCRSSSFTKDLTLSSVGNDVKQLQIFLNGHGYVIAKTGVGSKGNETTTFGKATIKALSVFQKANKLKADGRFAGATRQLIQSMMPIVACVASTPNAPAALTRDLKSGSTGDDVKQLQIFLNAHGYLITKSGEGSKGNEGTSFGSATKKALSAFQKANKLKVDGLFAGKTKSLIQTMK